MESICFDGTVDLRPAMEFDVPYERLDADRCTACARNGGWGRILVVTEQDGGLVVTKHHHEGMPLGFLFSRCPEHQLAWEHRLWMASREEAVA